MGKRGPKPLSAEELAKRGSWRAGRRALEEAAAASGATGTVSAAHDAAAPPEPKETAPAAPLPEGYDLDAWLPLLLLLPKWDPRAQAKGFRFDGEKARHVIEWFEAHVRHLTGSKRGELVRLEPFQRSFLANLFGWVHDGGPRDGLRRFTKALLYIGGKNGKSTLLGGLAAYAFTELAEGGAKVLTAATSRPQARTVWEIARDTICADQPTLAKCVVRHADIRLVSDQAAVLKPISGEVEGEDGAECFFAILDELHRQNDTELLDVLEKGGSTRDEAVLVILTTADEIRESPCNNELAYAKSVRDNPGDDQRAGFNPSYLPAVYELDDGDDWTKEENWHKANPGLGTIKSLEFMRGLAREAKERRDKRPGFQRLHLNLRVQSIAAAIRWPKWEGCAGPDDWLALRAKMAGRPCILGGDLAETNDMVALIAWFYEDSVVVPFYWACKAAAEERFRKNEPVYFRWRDAGALDLVDHDAIELAPVVERIEWCTKTYRVMDVGVDAAKAQELIFAARVYGLDPIRVEQGWKTMTEPCDKLTQLVENGRVRHGRHPVLDWNVMNLRWKLYGASAKKPVKPSESQKIDGCSAWLTALAVALRKPPKPPSVYETRGVRVL